jgi:hypothetical protein
MCHKTIGYFYHYVFWCFWARAVFHVWRMLWNFRFYKTMLPSRLC